MSKSRVDIEACNNFIISRVFGIRKELEEIKAIISIPPKKYLEIITERLATIKAYNDDIEDAIGELGMPKNINRMHKELVWLELQSLTNGGKVNGQMLDVR